MANWHIIYAGGTLVIALVLAITPMADCFGIFLIGMVYASVG